MPTERKRVAIVTDEILGITRNAGGASANTFLSFALADVGHEVEIHFAAPVEHGVARGWQEQYARRGIRIRPVHGLPFAVVPSTATAAYSVRAALLDNPPDVVIVDDRYGAGYAAARARALGLEFPTTL